MREEKAKGTAGVDLRRMSWRDVRAGALRAWERHAFRERWPAQSWAVFEHITRLVWIRGRVATDAAPYAWPSEVWLGEQAGVCRETVSRWVWRLQRAGLLRIVNRRPERGTWRTNLYLLGGTMIASLVRMVSRGAAHRSKAAPPPGSTSPSSMASVARVSHAELDGLISRWFKRGESPGKGDL